MIRTATGASTTAHPARPSPRTAWRNGSIRRRGAIAAPPAASAAKRCSIAKNTVSAIVAADIEAAAAVTALADLYLDRPAAKADISRDHTA